MASKKRNMKLKGRLKSYTQTSLYLGFLLVAVNLLVYILDVPSGLVLTCFTLFYFGITVLLQLYNKPIIMNELVSFATQYGQIQKVLLRELELPYAMLDEEGRIIWTNARFEEVVHKEKGYRKSITSLFPSITREKLPDEEDEVSFPIVFEDRNYEVRMRKISMREMAQNSDIIDGEGYDGCLIAFYLFDETALKIALQEVDDQSLAVGMIYLDNYEEALDSTDDVRRSLLAGLIDKRVNKYFSPGSAIVRKLEKDKYIVVFRYNFLEKLMHDRFSLLEEIKSIKIGNEMTLTLSMGIGTGSAEYSKNYDVAKAAMDLALGRGGDQAVVKDGEKILYYGGKSQQMEKNTRVKGRVKAHALRQILDNNSNVLVMGHTLADIDAFGSALGIYVIAKKLGKEAHIVLGEVTSSVRPFVNRFIGKEEYPDDMFIKPEDASSKINASTVVIVVDVNRPQRTECPELLEKCKTVVVFDHHRRQSDTITGAVLSYVDPYASSASEMITEMIQYVDDNIKLKAFEADALYAGINIDTDGFNSKSGPRTFEAAAFLRRHGADVTRVRKMLRSNMNEYKEIAKAVSRVEVYKDAFAISIFNGDGIDTPTVGGAKTANDLLDISGIKASFVITPYEDKIYVSARSIDEVNVQLVMEKLGGGGHMSIAGAQLTDCTIDQAINKIKLTLDNMIKDGEI